MDSKQSLEVVGTLLTGLVVTDVAHSQLPFFTGQRAPKTYVLENRFEVTKDNGIKDIGIVKTFRNEVPIWVYLGNSYSERGLGDLFYGTGLVLNFRDRVYMLSTLEGSDGEINGGTLYSTSHLGKGYHVDVSPSLDENGNHKITNFNLGKTYKGVTFGVSSSHQNKRFRDLKDTDVRVAKIGKGNFISGSVNFGKKKVRVSFQKAIR